MRYFSSITHLHWVPRLRVYKDLLLCLLFTFTTWYSFTKITFTFFAHTTGQIHVLEFVLKIKTFMFSLDELRYETCSEVQQDRAKCTLRYLEIGEMLEWRVHCCIWRLVKCQSVQLKLQTVHTWRYVKCWSRQLQGQTPYN